MLLSHRVDLATLSTFRQDRLDCFLTAENMEVLLSSRCSRKLHLSSPAKIQFFAVLTPPSFSLNIEREKKATVITFTLITNISRILHLVQTVNFPTLSS